MQSCPKCASFGPIRFGTKTLSRFGLGDGGRLERATEAVQRFRCGSCGHIFAPVTERDVRTSGAVVDFLMKSNISAAAAHFGCDDTTISRMLTDWIAAREPDLVELPALIGLTPFKVSGRDCLVVTSPVEGQLIDLLASRQDVARWISRRGSSPSLVSSDFDVQLHEALQELTPQPKVMVTPTLARRAIETAGITSFRILVRDGMTAGRNYKESVVLLRKPETELTPIDKDDLLAWAPHIRQFRFAFQTLLLDLATACVDKFSVTMTQVVASLARNAPGCALHRLLTRWGGAIVLGVKHRWVDKPNAVAILLRDEIRRLRPNASFDTLRAILLFSHRDAVAVAPDLHDAVAALRYYSRV